MFAQLIAFFLVLAGARLDTVATAAVVSFEAMGASVQDAEILTERFRTELAARKAYRLVERSRMDEILREQGFQQTGCTSTECAVQTGRLLGVRRTIAGTVSHMGATWSVAAREIDVETGEILRSAVVDLQANVDDVLTSGMARLADKLLGRSPRSDGVAFIDGLRQAFAGPVAAVIGKDSASTTPAAQEPVTAPPEPPAPVAPQQSVPDEGEIPIAKDAAPFQLVVAVIPIPPAKHVNGIAINAGWGHIVQMRGVQAGIANQVDSAFQGVQGGVINLVGTQRGIQGGVVNYAGAMRGLQGGFINAAGGSHGIQVGFLNISDENHGIQFGLLNLWKNNGKARVFPLVGGIF